MRTKLWGRARWVWALDLIVVVCFVIVFIETDRPAIKLIAAVCVLLRLVISATLISGWRSKQRRAADDARDNRVMPPR